MAADDLDFALKSPDADRDLFEMATLCPGDTGLNMTIWVSPRGQARHDVQIKVCMTPGDRMDAVESVQSLVRLP